MPPAKRKRVLEDTDSEDDAPLAQPLAAATPMVDGAEAVAETPGSTRPRRRRRLMKQTDDDEGFAEVFDAPASVPALAARPQAAQAGAQPSLAQRLQERRDQKKRDTLAAKTASALPDDAADAACASGASQDEAALATGNTARKLALLEKAILERKTRASEIGGTTVDVLNWEQQQPTVAPELPEEMCEDPLDQPVPPPTPPSTPQPPAAAPAAAAAASPASTSRQPPPPSSSPLRPPPAPAASPVPPTPYPARRESSAPPTPMSVDFATPAAALFACGGGADAQEQRPPSLCTPQRTPQQQQQQRVSTGGKQAACSEEGDAGLPFTFASLAGRVLSEEAAAASLEGVPDDLDAILRGEHSAAAAAAMAAAEAETARTVASARESTGLSDCTVASPVGGGGGGGGSEVERLLASRLQKLQVQGDMCAEDAARTIDRLRTEADELRRIVRYAEQRQEQIGSVIAKLEAKCGAKEAEEARAAAAAVEESASPVRALSRWFQGLTGYFTPRRSVAATDSAVGSPVPPPL